MPSLGPCARKIRPWADDRQKRYAVDAGINTAIQVALQKLHAQSFAHNDWPEECRQVTSAKEIVDFRGGAANGELAIGLR